MCWRGRDETRCQTYLLTELVVDRPFLSTYTTLRFGSGGFSESLPDYGTRVLMMYGLAWNRGDHSSLGVAGIYDMSSLGGPAGFEMRYRRWIDTAHHGWEVSGGYARRKFLRTPDCGGGFCGAGEVMGNGLRGGAAVVVGPYLTVYTRAELLRAAPEWRGSWSMGASANSTASIALFTAAYGFLYMVFASGYT